MTIGLYGSWHGIEAADTVNALLIAVRIMNESEALDFDLDSRGRLPIETEREIQAHVLRQMQFTFGHEYAHYLCHHLELPEQKTMHEQDVSREDAVGFSSMGSKVFEFELEYEADLYAVKAVATNPDAGKRVANGAFSVLLYLYFLEGTRALFKMKPLSVSRTHPTAMDRIWRLWGSLSPSVRPGKSWLDECIKANEQAQELLRSYVMYQSQNDLLTFYGSIYLPNYRRKIPRDRIDF